MSLYDIAYVTWPVLLALLVAIPGVLLFANRRAWQDGYAQCDRDYNEADTTEDQFDQMWDEGRPVDVERLIEPYTVNTDTVTTGKSFTLTACACTTNAKCALHGDEEQARQIPLSRVDPPSANYPTY